MNCCFVVLCILLFTGSPILAQDATKLSRDINKELRSAQSLMFKGKAQEAQGLLGGIQTKIEQLKLMDPNHRSLKGLERKYDKLHNDLTRRLKKAPLPKAPEIATPETPEVPVPKKQKLGGPKAAVGKLTKLKSGAARCVREMDKAMKGVERSLNSKYGTPESRTKGARKNYEHVEGYWNDLNKKYPETLGHPDVIAAKERMDATSAKIDTYDKRAASEMKQASETKAAKAARSAKWIEKLRPFVLLPSQKGYVPEEAFIASYTEEPAEMDKRMKQYAEASNLFSEYEKAEFPEGKTDELLDIEKLLTYKLETYEKELKTAANRHLEKASIEIMRCKENLAKNEERTKDGKAKPIMINLGTINSISKNIVWAEGLDPGDSRIPGLKRGLEEVKNEQSRWREKMIESTTMMPHSFSGNESRALKDVAKDIVSKKFPEAKVLKVNIITPSWKEERAIEYTDTARTAIRYRITRRVTGQVAAEQGTNYFLYTVYIGKDRLSDGTWGQYYGHVMFTDRMLEKNVAKD